MANIDYSQVRTTGWSCGAGGNAPPGTILNLPHELVSAMVAIGACTVIEDDPYNAYNPFVDAVCTDISDLTGDHLTLTAVEFGKTYNTYI